MKIPMRYIYIVSATVIMLLKVLNVSIKIPVQIGWPVSVY